MTTERTTHGPFEIPPIYGVWLVHGGESTEGCWMLLGLEAGSGACNMPHVFSSREDANRWIKCFMHTEAPGDVIVVALNDEAGRIDND